MKKKTIRIAVLLLGIVCLLVLTREDNVNWQDSKLIKIESDVYTININSDMKNASIVINTENLADKGAKEVSLIQKTNWFPCVEGESLCMYGGFNYAVWEFELEDGKVITIDHSYMTFNNPLDTALENRSCDNIDIPSGALRCRVSYYKALKGTKIAIREVGYGITGGNLWKRIKGAYEAVEINNALQYQKLYISYGSVPTTATQNKKNELKIGRLSEGDCIEYSKGNWKLIRNNGMEDLDFSELHVGNSVSIVSEGIVKFELNANGKEKSDKSVYGVKWKYNDNEMVCTRVEDGQYLHTNYMKNGKYMLPYENDFDDIFPWSEMKECYIDDDGNIYYDEVKENLNCMIEIPKFYYKREQVDGYEYIYISKSKLKGFQIEPAFIGKDGEMEKIYVGKYLTSMQDDEVGSYSNNVPLIDISYDKLLDLIKQKGEGWAEIDLITLNMLQKLWIVETGVLNSQSVFAGYTESNFIWSSDDDPKYAVKTEENTNTIWIKKDEHTLRFEEGDPVIVISYNYEDKYSAYKYFTDNYINDDSEWQRRIEKIELHGDLLEIVFSGSAIDIKKNSSIIANLPDYCGVTDDVHYGNAEVGDLYGKTSFKYRGIENLWGTVCVLLGGVQYKNNNLYIQYPAGDSVVWKYDVIEQNNVAAASRSYEVAVNKMGYDVYNSSIIFPEEISNGATLTNSYGDWFALSKDEHYSGNSDVQCLTYGMTWDLANYAGLFAYRIQPHVDSNMVEIGSRLIFRE